MMRTASGGSLRGVGGNASRNQRQQQHRGRDPCDDTYDDEDDDERERDNDDDDDDDDTGFDSDTMSVMDQDAIRASMRKRGARATAGAGGRRGDTVEQRARKLGMLLERHDEWPDGREKRSERAIVKMVVDSGPAQIRGVTVGSKVKRVNGETVEGLTYQQTLECIKVGNADGNT
ncbi:unnamed protein product [Ectocarpus sp. CCAP 1310/34]|nr:unnamed protein product [Ectocarpus sp. CCAP 1310/34]